jgi:HSP20 family molecular chaperone IbpA
MSFLNKIIPSLGNAGECAGGGSCATRRPSFQVNETPGAYDLTVYLPGVSKEGLEITDEGGELRITGKRASALPEGLAVLHRETSEAPYALVLDHDDTVDSGKIEAELRDGVLRVSFAKAESAKPRKISVN